MCGDRPHSAASSWSNLASRAVGLSYAEIARAASDIIKDALIARRSRVRVAEIRATLEELRSTREQFGKQGA